MIVLGIETATPQSSIALGTETQMLGSIAISAERGHQEVLVPAIERLLGWTGVSLSNVGGIAVGTGPGQSAVTRTPRGLSSACSASLNETT